MGVTIAAMMTCSNCKRRAFKFSPSLQFWPSDKSIAVLTRWCALQSISVLRIGATSAPEAFLGWSDNWTPREPPMPVVRSCNRSSHASPPARSLTQRKGPACDGGVVNGALPGRRNSGQPPHYQRHRLASTRQPARGRCGGMPRSQPCSNLPRARNSRRAAARVRISIEW